MSVLGDWPRILWLYSSDIGGTVVCCPISASGSGNNCSILIAAASSLPLCAPGPSGDTLDACACTLWTELVHCTCSSGLNGHSALTHLPNSARVCRRYTGPKENHRAMYFLHTLLCCIKPARDGNAAISVQECLQISYFDKQWSSRILAYFLLQRV